MSSARHILVLYAHPNPARSRAHKVLHRAIHHLEGVEVRDLYQLYPHFYIDVGAEQEALQRADLIIFQHPIYWYSCPALLKEWQDMVLEQGFAYGEGGTALQGKDFLQVVSSGGMPSAYQREGGNRFLMAELLRPFEATAFLCGLNYHHPITVQGINNLNEDEIHQQAQSYRDLLIAYREQGSKVLDALDTAREGFPS